MAGGARLLLIAVAALALSGGTVAQARPSQAAHDAARKAGAGDGKAAGSPSAARRALRVRKRARRRGSHGHVPAWLKVVDPFATPAPGNAPQTPGTPEPGTPQTPGSPDPGTTPGTPPSTPACGAATGARESEWYVKPSRTTLCAGQVTIEAQNYGQDPHDLRLSHDNGAQVASWPELAPGNPGGVLAKKVTLAPGRYTLYCSLIGGTPPGTPGESHAAAGMTATITVVAP